MLERYYSSQEAECQSPAQCSVMEAAVRLHLYGSNRDNSEQDDDEEDEDIDAIVDDWKASH